MEVYCGSQSAIHLAKNQVHHRRTKHIDVRFHFIQEIIKHGDVILKKIGTKHNPVDDEGGSLSIARLWLMF